MKRFRCQYYSAVKWFEWLLLYGSFTLELTHKALNENLVMARLDWVTMGEL